MVTGFWGHALISESITGWALHRDENRFGINVAAAIMAGRKWKFFTSLSLGPRSSETEPVARCKQHVSFLFSFMWLMIFVVWTVWRLGDLHLKQVAAMCEPFSWLMMHQNDRWSILWNIIEFTSLEACSFFSPLKGFKILARTRVVEKMLLINLRSTLLHTLVSDPLDSVCPDVIDTQKML